jgi:hypothetical protein
LTVDELTASLAAIHVLFNLSTIRASTIRLRSVRPKPGAGGWEVCGWLRCPLCPLLLRCSNISYAFMGAWFRSSGR